MSTTKEIIHSKKNTQGFANAFLQTPTSYSVDCASEGTVLTASLSAKGIMKISYHSIWHDGDHSGIFLGKYDEITHRFDGRYKTNDNRFEGEINFTFNEKGEAKGTWDYGSGKVTIALE